MISNIRNMLNSLFYKKKETSQQINNNNNSSYCINIKKDLDDCLSKKKNCDNLNLIYSNCLKNIACSNNKLTSYFFSKNYMITFCLLTILALQIGQVSTL